MRIRQDEMGQTVLEGMGELHIEIIKVDSRIANMMNVMAHLGAIETRIRS